MKAVRWASRAWLVAAGGAALGAALIGGCAPTSLNERLAIGVSPTASFSERTRHPEWAERAAEEHGVFSMRALSARDRRSWATLVDVAPIDGVVHDPTLRRLRPISRRAEGWRVGAYPEPGTGAAWAPPDDVWTAAGELGRACVDALLLQIRSVSGLVRASRLTPAWSPATVWKRTRTDQPRAGTVPAVRGEAEPRPRPGPGERADHE